MTVSPSPLDRIIGAFSPRLAFDRMQARVAMQGLQKAVASYDGAARNHRTAGRRVGQTSANTETRYALHRLRDMSRDLVRNNAYAARAIQVIASNVVGPGITAHFDHENERVKKAIERLADQHLYTPAIDFDGRHDLCGLETLIARTVAESGEALVLRHRPPASLRLKVPVQVRVLEPDYLTPYLDTVMTPSGGCIVQGIEYDKAGRRVAYHMFRDHPGNWYAWQTLETVRVPAEDVLHVYRSDRPGQSRGVPWGAPVIMTMSDLHDYEDAELMRQKIAACFAVFWVDSDGATRLAQDAAAGNTQTGLGVDMLEPGMQQRLPPGVDVKFATPPVTQGFEAYVRASVRKIAIGYGVPYEALAGDLSQVNFSSGRMGWLEFQRSIIQWQYQMMIPHACAGIGKWFLEAAEFIAPGASKASIKWSEPRREMIDPTKEIPAARDAVRAGLSTLSAELRRMGEDPEKIFAELAADQKRLDALGLVLESDGRKPIASGEQPTSTDAKLPGDPKHAA